MSATDTVITQNQPHASLSMDTQKTPDIVENLRVIRRNGKVTVYTPQKITVAVTKAFLAVEGAKGARSERIHHIVDAITQYITDTFTRRQPQGGTIHIEDIQDQVELALMRDGHHQVAKAYVLYREERRRERETKAKQQENIQKTTLHIINKHNERVVLDEQRLQTLVEHACDGLTDVDAHEILAQTLRNLYDGMPANEINKALVMAARTRIELEPNYSYVTARLLLDGIYAEGLDFLGIDTKDEVELSSFYPQALSAYIKQGITLERLDPVLAEFDLTQLGEAIVAERDRQFGYLGLQTLYDRYFIHQDGIRYELPQVFFMRVAMGLAINEKNRIDKAIEFYHVLSKFDFMSSTPTLFNAGTTRPQLSSCFLTTIDDDLNDIFSSVRDNALLSKFAGGIGNDWTPVRAMGAHIKGTNGSSLGVVPFMNVANATAVAVNQGGKRKGAVCGYLETWHLDIEEFLELRKNTGDDRRRTHDMNTANWIPDLFMQRVFEDKEWTLFSPDDVPGLHDSYGQLFKEKYEFYEAKTKTGEIKHFKTIRAVTLWRKMLGLLYETGHPWLTFKDPCNIRSPQQHKGVVHSSNLCTEITLNTNQDEVAVCNLGSINLAAHVDSSGLDVEKLQHTIKVAVRMLDNVIDLNYYTIPQAKHSNLQHRPIGLGIMGFQDALYRLGLDYCSEQAVEFADISMETISYYALKASSVLAKERGSYASFAGSLWSQGILPIDSIALLKQARGDYLEQNDSQTLDWDSLRQTIMQQGMRHSNILAIAPTATISNICGVSQSIEPTFQNLYVKSNMSGEFTTVNPYLVDDLKQLGLWDTVMVNDLKYYDGSVQDIDRIPRALKSKYANAFEIDVKWLVEAASRRQKWIDQAQSLNLYIAKPSGKKLDKLYRMAWLRGLKTTYYLRSLAASSTEKATISRQSLNAVDNTNTTVKACAIDDPDCEACQ